MQRSLPLIIGGLALTLGLAVLSAQSASIWVSRDHPAIQYSSRPVRDAVVKVNERVEKGEVHLEFDAPPRGYLASVLKALDIPISSQTLVFSENSLQRAHISKATPRAIYFNDTVAVGWAKGAETVEVTVFDANQGVHFYSIPQINQQKPQFVRRDGDCLQCHLLPQTHGVPGVLTMSVLPLSDNQNEYAQGWAADHRTPIEDRWGGWYVTGKQVPAKHLGNVPVLHVPRSYVRADTAPTLMTASEAFDTASYLTPHSDVAALMVLNHQTHMTNLFTRLNWQARSRPTMDQRQGRCHRTCAIRRASSPTTCCSRRKRHCRRPCEAHRHSRRTFRRKGLATAKGVRCASLTSLAGCFATRAVT